MHKPDYEELLKRLKRARGSEEGIRVFHVWLIEEAIRSLNEQDRKQEERSDSSDETLNQT